MSTRANITFIEQGEKINLYHHHDGYPECLGLQIRLLCMAGIANNYTDGIKDLICGKIDRYVEKMTPEMVSMLPGWEDGKFTDDDWEPSYGLHGDTDFDYTIEHDYENGVTVTCERTWRESGNTVEGEFFHPVQTRTVVFITRYKRPMYPEKVAKETVLYADNNSGIKAIEKGGEE
jgi:hypothetical protein